MSIKYFGVTEKKLGYIWYFYGLNKIIIQFNPHTSYLIRLKYKMTYDKIVWYLKINFRSYL